MAAPQGWSRWYDDAPEHPKFLEAGHRAGWLYVCGQAYASRQATDGRIPKSVVPRLTDVPTPMKVARRLVEVGLWHDRGDHYEQHDYTEMQATAEEREAKRREANERKRRERERRAADKAKREATGVGAPPPEDDGSHTTVTRDTPRDVTRDNGVTSRDRHSDVLAGARAKPEAEAEAEVLQGQDQTPSSTHVDPPADPDDGFEHFWNAWPKRNGKKLARDKAHRAWTKLTLPERREAFRGAKHYAAASATGLAGAKDAFRWLQAREWPDWQEPAVPDQRAKGPPRPSADDDVDYRAGWAGREARA